MGKEKVAWYFTVAAFLLAPLIILVIVAMCCIYIRCCRCCCKEGVDKESPKKPKLNQIEISNEK